jgi:hypothetical protein
MEKPETYEKKEFVYEVCALTNNEISETDFRIEQLFGWTEANDGDQSRDRKIY